GPGLVSPGLDLTLEPGEPVVPAGADIHDPPRRLGERRGGDLVAATADLTSTRDKTRILEQREMLRDGLAGHRHAGGQLGEGRGARGGQGPQQSAPRRVRERLEDGVVVRGHHRAFIVSAIAGRSRMRTSVPDGTRWSSIVTRDTSP